MTDYRDMAEIDRAAASDVLLHLLHAAAVLATALDDRMSDRRAKETLDAALRDIRNVASEATALHAELCGGKR